MKTSKRKEDGPLERTRFRSDRLVQEGGNWFFLTREGSVEGPFSCRIEALQRLELYARLASFDPKLVKPKKEPTCA